MKRIPYILLLLATMAQAQFVMTPQQAASNAVSDLGAVTSTTANMTLYVETTGNDANDCTTTLTPCLTIQGAVNKVPKRLKHIVTVNVGTGTFSTGAWLNGFVPDIPADPTAGSYLIIQGTMVASPVATGSVTGTLTGYSAGSGATWGTMTDSGQSWTSGELRGKFIEITSGPATGLVKVISDNTGTVITLAGSGSLIPTAPTVGSTYRISEVGTTISGMTTMPSSPIAIAAGVTAAAASWFVDGPTISPAIPGDARVIVRRFKYGANVTRAFGLYADVGLMVMQSRFEPTIANARAFVLNKFGSISARDNSVNMTSSGGFVEGQQGQMTRTIDFQNNVINGCGNVTISGNVGFYRSQGNSIVGAGRAHHFGTIYDGQINSDKYSGMTGVCMEGNAGGSDTTVGTIAVINTAFGTCQGNVIALNGPIQLTFIDSGSGSSGVANSGYGLGVSEGASIRLSSLTNITGTLADLLVDVNTTSLAALRANTPKVFYYQYQGSRIFER